ncbi:Regulator of nucleoside diphosphate kinase (plasmid) [Caballeronia sp. SBC1]|uniref:GreA/GreB family elongation factor n=1 Tax=unclassified Caballeronia TaxID=2646786 RepID=UPI0013E18208|nr:MULTISPECIES: GreA/GreB family elongation factor [unclassified Caballeronia]QIE27294.1 Regulator of nucleoside diphosphate kinase [Caballeronia sp. SBC2]QIN65225.1 Regulator of nucleoside diphosphate kinase [Caballeronia sp. SBC1]
MPILSELDMERLKRCARVSGASSEQRTLVEELEETAMLLDAAEVPADVVMVNTRIECTEVASGHAHQWTLVYPDEADYERGCISVLSPAGFALLGARVGQIVECRPPSGVPVQYIVQRILFRPEQFS